MIEKELEEKPIDLEEEFLDVNISTFGKFFPIKNLEKTLGNSIYQYYLERNKIWKEEIILEYIKIKIEKNVKKLLTDAGIDARISLASAVRTQRTQSTTYGEISKWS